MPAPPAAPWPRARRASVARARPRAAAARDGAQAVGVAGRGRRSAAAHAQRGAQAGDGGDVGAGELPAVASSSSSGSVEATSVGTAPPRRARADRRRAPRPSSRARRRRARAAGRRRRAPGRSPGRRRARDDRSRSAVGVVPEQRRVVERVGGGRRGRQERASSARDRVAARARAARRRAAAASSAASAESPPEQVITASPPSPRGRAPRHRQRLGQLEQLVRRPAPTPRRASSTSARNDALVAGHRARVRRGRAAPAAERAGLEHRDADARAGAQRSSAAHQRAPSPSSSRYSATERTPSRCGERVRASRRRRARPGCRTRRPCAGAARAATPSALTATLPLCETSATGPASRGATVSPHSAARSCSATIPLPLGPHTGSSWRAAAARSASCRRAPSRASPKPAANTTAPPQPRAPASSITSGTPAAGIATTTASRRLGQVGQRRARTHAVHARRVGLTRADAAAEAEPPRGCAAPRRRRRRAGSVAPTTAIERGAQQRRRGPCQCSTRSTPRRSSARATIRRWISLVPSQMRSTRSSRQKRSATFVRM